MKIGFCFGDFLIEPGNSGGPLVNLDGHVVGINTFGVRGIAGAVPVRILRGIVEGGALSRYDAPEPSTEPLPTLSTKGYPTELLKVKILEPALDDDAYELDADKFTIQAITPVRLGRLHVREDLIQAQNRMDRRGDRMNDPGLGLVDAPFYEWVRNAAPWLDYAVTLEIKPEFGRTAGSMWAAMATAVATGFAAGYTGTPQPLLLPRQDIEFKAEFQDFRLYRDGRFIEPITPGRQITESAFQSYEMTFIDEAYSGMYVYSPEAFVSGERFRFEVYDAREPERIHKSIEVDSGSELIRQIRLDFEGADPARPGAARIWPAEHEHTSIPNCKGEVLLTEGVLQFVADDGEHAFSAVWSEVRDLSARGTSGPGGFRVILDRGLTFNLRLLSEPDPGLALQSLIRAADAVRTNER